MIKILLPFNQKIFNFVNTDTPCRKKAKEREKNFHQNCYVARFKKFVDYEITSECQLYKFW